MTEILAKVKVRGCAKWWLILDCGHWFKWTGAKPPSGDEFQCVSCRPLPIVVSDTGGEQP